TNGLVKSASSPIVIPYLDDERILSDLEAAREAADFVLVSVHWGIENTFTPTDEQRRLAVLFAENGADAIIGHHSHCLQPIEWIETERGRVICVYSLGNFFSGMAWPMNQVGGMFTFHIVGDGNGGLCVADPVFLPTVFYYGMDWFDTHIYLLDNYTDEIAAKHGVGMTGATLRPDEARQMVTDVIADEFLRLS
ncbi:MAG: CapA family protein, partial [Eubacteriales bacterium]